MDFEQKKAHVVSLVDHKRKLGGGAWSTFIYTLNLDGEKREVCREMFMNTLGISVNQFHYWFKKEVKEKVPILYQQTRNKNRKQVAQNFLKKKKWITHREEEAVSPFTIALAITRNKRKV